ncbi:MAG: M20/M25/M40 family metallo-hydrolase [Candidatus Gottesmanbacteria bacterium]|nr:M20/M25/M40 family metallo-hydrolase [Candidatus Gottesmanbacteria bacterium]
MSTQTLLTRLVKIPSYSGQERALAAFIMDWASAHGMQTILQQGNVIIPFAAHANKALIFNAHMDTVKPGQENLWTYPPSGQNAGVVKNGKLYGLGASDDKAAIASFLLLALQLQASPPPIDVFIVFVTGEETDGSGSQSFVQYFQKKYATKYQKVAAIIGEPTDLQTIEIGHRGNMFLQITTQGDAGHGSQPKNIKTHAVIENIKAIEKIVSLEKSFINKFSDPILGSPSCCLTGIQSDTSSPNSVSSTCSSLWDVRTTPKIHSEVIPLMQKALGKTVEITLVGKPASFGFTKPDSKIVTKLKELIPSVKVAISPGSNDICAFTAAGISAVTFGPGQKDTIHKPDEYVQLQKIDDAVDVYKQLIYSW